jgi:hypothetical protein
MDKLFVKTVDGVVEYFNEPLITDGKQIFNPSEEQIKAAGWEEYTPEETASEEYVPTYEEKVIDLIREKYTIDDEFAILRQRYSKPEEFDRYFNFCEQCKLIAKNEQN